MISSPITSPCRPPMTSKRAAVMDPGSLAVINAFDMINERLETIEKDFAERIKSLEAERDDWNTNALACDRKTFVAAVKVGDGKHECVRVTKYYDGPHKSVHLGIRFEYFGAWRQDEERAALIKQLFNRVASPTPTELEEKIASLIGPEATEFLTAKITAHYSANPETDEALTFERIGFVGRRRPSHFYDVGDHLPDAIRETFSANDVGHETDVQQAIFEVYANHLVSEATDESVHVAALGHRLVVTTNPYDNHHGKRMMAVIKAAVIVADLMGIKPEAEIRRIHLYDLTDEGEVAVEYARARGENDRRTIAQSWLPLHYNLTERERLVKQHACDPWSTFVPHSIIAKWPEAEQAAAWEIEWYKKSVSAL